VHAVAVGFRISRGDVVVHFSESVPHLGYDRTQRVIRTTTHIEVHWIKNVACDPGNGHQHYFVIFDVNAM
jgi:hypothetical protein